MQKIIYSVEDIIGEIRLASYLLGIPWESVQGTIPRIEKENGRLVLLKIREGTRVRKEYVVEYFQNNVIVRENWKNDPGMFLKIFSKRYLLKK